MTDDGRAPAIGHGVYLAATILVDDRAMSFCGHFAATPGKIDPVAAHRERS
jgi:hypothetical protein